MIITHAFATCGRINETQSVDVPKAQGHIFATINSVVGALNKGATGYRTAAASGNHFSKHLTRWYASEGKSPAGESYTEYGELHVVIKPTSKATDAEIITSIRDFVKNTDACLVFGIQTELAESLAIVVHRPQQQCGRESAADCFSR